VGLFVDGSPQERSTEFFASSYDQISYYDSGGTQRYRYRRRQFPPLRIGSHLLNMKGKLYCLIFQIWLLVGPDVADVRKFCSRVSSITTDQGTESKLFSGPDILRSFAVHHSLPLPWGWKDQARCFPHCVAAPGWCHLCDGLLRRTVLAVSFFGKWLEDAKVFVRFLRNHKNSIVRDLKVADEGAAAEIFSGTPFDKFAHWRWNTLYDVCKAIKRTYLLLQSKWGRLPFLQKVRDEAAVNCVMGSLASTSFHQRLMFVLYVAQKFSRLQKFGQGCECHKASVQKARTHFP
jgi:hypothetical protein